MILPSFRCYAAGVPVRRYLIVSRGCVGKSAVTNGNPCLSQQVPGKLAVSLQRHECDSTTNISLHSPIPFSRFVVFYRSRMRRRCVHLTQGPRWVRCHFGFQWTFQFSADREPCGDSGIILSTSASSPPRAMDDQNDTTNLAARHIRLFWLWSSCYRLVYQRFTYISQFASHITT